MERFVFVAAVTCAIIFGVVSVFGGRHFDFDVDIDGPGAAPVVAVTPGVMQAQAYQGAELRIKSAAATVIITPEDRSDFLIEIDNTPGHAPMPAVSSEGGTVTIDGQLRGRISDCNAGGADLRGYGVFTAADLPRITIRAPRNVTLDRGGAGTTQIGASDSVNLDFSGCGDATIADTAGPLELDVAGSGAINAGAAASLDADVAGASAVNVGAVAGGATIDLAGSGTVIIAALNGDLSSDSAGSGNVDVRSGSIGAAKIDLAGSGGVDIAAPVRSLEVSIMGSGDVNVAGEVGTVEAEIAGSGNVSARSVTGSVRQEVFGSGGVNIGTQNAP